MDCIAIGGFQHHIRFIWLFTFGKQKPKVLMFLSHGVERGKYAESKVLVGNLNKDGRGSKTVKKAGNSRESKC